MLGAMTVTADVRSAAQARLRWELLENLVRKDLKVKYKNSTLGFLWSLANPLLLLAVYYVVFSYILKTGIPDFAVYLMSGLLVWNAFSTSVMSASGSVVNNADLVKKVRFQTGVLPLSSVGFAGVHFLMQLGVFGIFLAIFYRHAFGPQLLLIIPALAVLILFTVGLSLVVAALTVRYRDISHLLEVALLAWFWLNPIIYSMHLVRNRLGPEGLLWVYFLNPIASVIASFQRAIYRTEVVKVNGEPNGVLAFQGYADYFKILGAGALISLVLLALGITIFRRMQGDFAEDL
jgi:ABC-2 type transport system permease protein